MRGVPLERGLQEPGKSPPPPTPLPRQSTSPTGPGAQPHLTQRQGADEVPRWDHRSRDFLPGAVRGAVAGVDQVLPLCGAGSFAFCLQPPLHARWHGGKGRTARTCLQARGPVLGMLLTLWFQHYFRKKRSLQKIILKKYEPLTRYLSVSHLNFECGGQIQ